jgi:hypothetical protein
VLSHTKLCINEEKEKEGNSEIEKKATQKRKEQVRYKIILGGQNFTNMLYVFAHLFSHGIKALFVEKRYQCSH